MKARAKLTVILDVGDEDDDGEKVYEMLDTIIRYIPQGLWDIGGLEDVYWEGDDIEYLADEELDNPTDGVV